MTPSAVRATTPAPHHRAPPDLWARARARRGGLVALLVTFARVAAAQTSATAVAPTPPAAAAAATLSLQPGDALKLVVWRVPELDGEYAVAPDGTLAHPAFRSLVVAGVPLVRVQSMLDSAVRAENVGARAVMQPLLQVVIDGEVRVPRLYRYPAGTSIADALALSGGLTERANRKRLQLVRNGTSTYFDLTDAAGPASRVPIVSGDRLLLPRRRASFVSAAMPYAAFAGAIASIATLVDRLGR